MNTKIRKKRTDAKQTHFHHLMLHRTGWKISNVAPQQEKGRHKQKQIHRNRWTSGARRDPGGMYCQGDSGGNRAEAGESGVKGDDHFCNG